MRFSQGIRPAAIALSVLFCGSAMGQSHGPTLDPLVMARRLISHQSVTPADDGAIDLLAEAARGLGFETDVFEACEQQHCVKNLVAQLGEGKPGLAFVGHTDVVPPGPLEAWTFAPFAATVADGQLWGRGAADMKGGLAAFLAAAARWHAQASGKRQALQLLVTGDEEIGSELGMRAIMRRYQDQDRWASVGLIGEGSSEGHLGQGVRVGRRGSLNVTVNSVGKQGHVAWPQNARNAVHPLVQFLALISSHHWGTPESIFPTTSLQITNVTVANQATNVVPGDASARFNVRFNRQFSGQRLQALLQSMAHEVAPSLQLTQQVSGEPYVCGAPRLQQALRQSIFVRTGVTTSFNAGGGVSDGRFLRQIMPVLEFGLPGDTAHQIDEHVRVADLYTLSFIYEDILNALL